MNWDLHKNPFKKGDSVELVVNGIKYVTKDGRELRLIKVWGNTFEFIDKDWNTYYIKAEEIKGYIK